MGPNNNNKNLEGSYYSKVYGLHFGKSPLDSHHVERENNGENWNLIVYFNVQSHPSLTNLSNYSKFCLRKGYEEKGVKSSF